MAEEDQYAGADPELWTVVYEELRRRAHRVLARERGNHTLCTTALVHEAYSKISVQSSKFANRAHFLAVAAMAMRRILVSYARERRAQKRGGEPIRVTLSGLAQTQDSAEDVIAIDELLTRLAALSERQSLVVTYKFYAELTDQEIADALGVSLPTVRRDWRAARAWIALELRALRDES